MDNLPKKIKFIKGLLSGRVVQLHEGEQITVDDFVPVSNGDYYGKGLITSEEYLKEHPDYWVEYKEEKEEVEAK